MSLPSAWTDRIFAKLSVTYGQRFLGLYAGIDLEAVKADWGHELRAYAQAPKAIAHALDCLPVDRPPTVLEFRALCRSAPQYAPERLPAPRGPIPREMLQIAEAISKPKEFNDHKQWARDLKALDERGGNLTLAQRTMYRECLRADDGPAPNASAFTAIPNNILPPGMRE